MFHQSDLLDLTKLYVVVDAINKSNTLNLFNEIGNILNIEPIRTKDGRRKFNYRLFYKQDKNDVIDKAQLDKAFKRHEMISEKIGIIADVKLNFEPNGYAKISIIENLNGTFDYLVKSVYGYHESKKDKGCISHSSVGFIDYMYSLICGDIDEVFRK